MKKILITLAALGFVSAANAVGGTTSTQLALNGTLASSCAASFSTSSLNFVFVPNQTATSQQATYNLTCTAGAQIATFTATSDNKWQFKGATSNDFISYSALSNGTPNYPTVATTWSGAPGVVASVNLIPAAITIDPAADPIVTTLTIIPDATPLAANVDNYSDTITIATSYS